MASLGPALPAGGVVPSAAVPRPVVAARPAPVPATVQPVLVLDDVEGVEEATDSDILRARQIELASALLGGYDLLPAFRACYELCSGLGVGAFGFVVSALHVVTCAEVAVKFISKASLARTKLPMQGSGGKGPVPSEIFVLQRLRHKHVLRFIEFFEDAKYLRAHAHRSCRQC